MIAAKPDSPVSKTRPSSFFGFRTKEGFEDHRTRDGSSTSLVPSRTHAQSEEDDPVDEGIEDKGRSSREGER
jgi:hypothetical protein